MDNGTISVRQFQVLVFFYTIGTTILITPAGLAADAKQDAWISAVLGVAIGLLFVWFYIKLGGRMNGMTFLAFSRQVLGRTLGTFVGAIFVFYGFLGSVTLLFYMGNFMTTQILPETPIQAVHMLFAAIIVMAARNGVATLARTAEIFYPWFIGLFFILCLMLIPEIRLVNLQPVMETEFRSLLKGGLNLASIAYMTLVTFIALFPARVKDADKAASSFMKGAMMGGLFIIAICWLTVAILGADTTERLVFPVYALAKKVSIGSFIERVEVLLAAIWFLSIYFKLSIYFYAWMDGLAELTRVQDSRKLALPLGVILVVFGQVFYPNTAFMQDVDTYTWYSFMWFIGIIVPSLLLIIGMLREKKR